MSSARLPLPVAAVLVALLPAAAPAQPLDPEPNTPYQWRVVLQAKPHPLLTAGFRDQVRRDILAALQPAVGPLGTVEVIDLDAVPVADRDPLWQEFAAKGFPALDAPRDLTGVKTHVLRLEVKDGAYHLEARQHDGFAGLASPLVRRQTVRAPELVGRAAGLLIDRDFGPAGTLELGAKPDEVTVRFKAGGLGPLDRVVKAGDVLAVAKINRPGRATAAVARSATGKVIGPAPGAEAPAALTPDTRNHAFTLLRVSEDPKDGAAKCAVLTNLKSPFPTGGQVAGYRCMKLGTVAGPVTVRLAGGDGTAAATAAAQVRASDVGFVAADPRDALDFVPAAGVFRSGRPLAGVACVTVNLGPSERREFAVPVLGPDPIPLPYAVTAAAEDKAVFERGVLATLGRAGAAREALKECFDAVAKGILAGKNPDALSRARAGFAAAHTAAQLLADEVKALEGQAAKSDAAGQLLAAVKRQVGSLRENNDLLKTRIVELEAIVGRADGKAAGGNLAQAVNGDISLLLARGKVREALAAYDQLITLAPQNAELKARRDKLAADWQPKDPAHEKARDYLELKWPLKNSLDELKGSLPELKAAVEACKKAGDKYALRRLLDDLVGFEGKLDGLTKDLDAAADPAGAAAGKLVRAEVEKVEQGVSEFVKANP